MPPKYRLKKDLNHNEIQEGLEELGFLVFNTSSLGNFVDLVVRCPSRPEIGVKLLEIKSEKGKLRKNQKELQALWGDSYLEVRDINDVLTLFGLI